MIPVATLLPPTARKMLIEAAKTARATRTISPINAAIAAVKKQYPSYFR